MNDVSINMNAEKFKIVLIGAGGTGGNLAPMIARLLSKKISTDFIIVDGDVVEVSNLERQPYLSSDVAVNKSESLSEKLNIAFGLNTKFYPHYIESVKQLESLCKCDRDAVTILIGAVDNHKARVIMEQYFSKASNLIYIDSANEDYFGDVICALKANNQCFLRSRGMYRAAEVFNGNGRVKNTSCILKIVENPQYYPTNQMAANIVLKMVSDIIIERNIHAHFVNFDTNDYVMFEEADAFNDGHEKVYQELLLKSFEKVESDVSIL